MKGQEGNFITLHPHEDIEDQVLFKQINQKTVNISDNSFGYLSQNSESFLRKIKQWDCEELYIYANGRHQILKDLQVISFSNLQSLSIRQNEITTIECIPFNQIPKIKELYLNYNKIRSVRQLRKCNMPLLTNLSLNSNPISDCETLNQGPFSKLYWLCLDWDSSESDSPVDLRWLFKGQKMPQILYICSLKRLVSPGVEKVLVKAEKNIKIERMNDFDQ